MTEAYPLAWPAAKPRTNRRDRSRFDVTFAKARDELFKELALMGARMPVLSTNVNLRRDGLPYANQPEPRDPGVAVYFTWKKRELCFSCDRWDRVRDNIQAIRHTISALRGLERWGTGDMVEAAFRGFEALPPPKGKEWFDVLEVSPNSSPEQIEESYRRLAKQHHPDLGGDSDKMSDINAAYKKAKSLMGGG